jgi:hypothetical protein
MEMDERLAAVVANHEVGRRTENHARPNWQP